MLDLTKPYVINAGMVPKQVGIIRLSDGAAGTIRVMGRGKVNIPDGFKKDSNWLALNGDKITVVEPSVQKQASTPTVTQTPASVTSQVAAQETTPASTVKASEASTDTDAATKGE